MYIDNGYCSIHDRQCEIDDICDEYEPNLSRVWEEFILVLGKELKLDTLIDWLAGKLSKSK